MKAKLQNAEQILKQEILNQISNVEPRIDFESIHEKLNHKNFTQKPIVNGKDGLNGLDGINGKDGINGLDGARGRTGINGLDGKSGINGINGLNGYDGKDGINGSDGAKGKSGINGLGFNWRGEFENNKKYLPMDVVTYNGSSYVCIVDSFQSTPKNKEFWNLFTKQGEKGLQGKSNNVGSGTGTREVYEIVEKYFNEHEKPTPPSSNGVNGSVFITDIQPQVITDNVSSKVYGQDNFVLESCLSNTQNIKVSVYALTGNTTFRPIIDINGIDVEMIMQPDNPVWLGTVNLTIDINTTELIATHNDGATYTSIIELQASPQVVSAMFSSVYPNSQTELKSGDVIDIEVVSNLPMTQISFEDFGAVVNQTKTFSECLSKTVSVTIANRGTTLQSLKAKLKVGDSLGNFGILKESENTVNTNNLYPSFSFSGTTYPTNQLAIKDNENFSENYSASNYDILTVTSPNNELTIINSINNVINGSRLGGTYNISTNNLRSVLVRSANGSSITINKNIKIANTLPTISIAFSTRLRSGGNNGTIAQNHLIRINSNQKLIEKPNIDSSVGIWQGTEFVGTTTTYTRYLQIHDNDTKGNYSWSNLTTKNLAGKIQTIISSGNNFVVGGFVFRILTVDAWINREVGIGTNISNTSKLRCTNLSKGSSGSLNFSYKSTIDNEDNKYTIVNNSTWYNCDQANAVSNSTGSMQIELEEII